MYLSKGDLTNEKTYMKLKELDCLFEAPEDLFISVENSTFYKFIRTSEKFRIINLNLELSKQLQKSHPKKHVYKSVELINEIVRNCEPNHIIVLNHIEILFDKSLKLKPLNVLKKISRNRKVLVLWPGKYEQNKLIYAIPKHKEYFEETNPDVKIIKVECYGEEMDYFEIQRIN